MTRFVVLDAMGVLYQHGNVVSGVLLPYLRDHDCPLTESEVRALYRRCTLGQLSTREFWEATGVARTASDTDYCRRHRLNPGTHDMLRGLQQAGVTVLVLTNDAGPWSAELRKRFELEAYVDQWFVSGEIGARKPDPAAYDAVRRHPRLDPAKAVLVDDRPTNLTAAQTAGFRPVLFHSEDTAANPAAELNAASARSMPELLDVLLTQ